MGDSKWKWTAAILCGVGLFKEFQPSKPFIVEYAVDFRNFTSEEIIHNILPVETYGYCVSLLFLLLITDFLRYKPIIILGGFAAVVCWSLTIWSYSTIFQAELREVADSISLSTSIAYFTYLYRSVDRSKYKRVTSYSHSALHMGRFLGGVCGQLALTFGGFDIVELNYVSLGGVSVALVLSLFLPKVKRSIYFHPRLSVISSISRTVDSNDTDESNHTRKSSMFRKMSVATVSKLNKMGLGRRLRRGFGRLLMDFKCAYTNRYVLKWSLWWAIAQAIYLQVGIYAEPLWKEIEEENHESGYNGMIDAAHALLSAVLAICIVFIKFPWVRWGEIYLSAISIFQGGVLFWMSQTNNLFVAYGCYIVFQTLFQVLIIVATTEVAESVKEDSEAFIFGINTLVALVIQTILTYAVTSESGFDLGIRDEFLVYSVYSGILGIIFLLIAIQRRNRNFDIEPMESPELHTYSPNKVDEIVEKNKKFNA